MFKTFAAQNGGDKVSRARSGGTIAVSARRLISSQFGDIVVAIRFALFKLCEAVSLQMGAAIATIGRSRRNNLGTYSWWHFGGGESGAPLSVGAFIERGVARQARRRKRKVGHHAGNHVMSCPCAALKVRGIQPSMAIMLNGARPFVWRHRCGVTSNGRRTLVGRQVQRRTRRRQLHPGGVRRRGHFITWFPTSL